MFIRFGSLAHHIVEDAYQLHLTDDSSYPNFLGLEDDRPKCLNVNDLEKKYSAILSDEDGGVHDIIDKFEDLGVLVWENDIEFYFNTEYGYDSDPVPVHLVGGLFDVIREGISTHKYLYLGDHLMGVPKELIFDGKASRAEENALDLLLKFENIQEGIVTYPTGDSGFFYSLPN